LLQLTEQVEVLLLGRGGPEDVEQPFEKRRETDGSGLEEVLVLHDAPGCAIDLQLDEDRPAPVC